MKNLKTYEEYNVGFIDAMSHIFTPGVNIGLGSWILLNIFTKYLGYRVNHNRFKDMFYTKGEHKGLYSGSRSGWSIDDSGEDITIKRNNNQAKTSFSINRRSRIFRYMDGDIKMFELKLSKRELKGIINDIEYVKLINDTIQDYFYDISDEGYDVKLGSLDFSNREFTIIIGGDPRNPGPNIESKIIDLINHIKSSFNVELDLSYKENYLYISDLSGVASVLNDTLYLKIGHGMSQTMYEYNDLYMASSNYKKTQKYEIILPNEIIIPFKKI